MREARAGGKNGRPDAKAQWQGTRELMSALSGLNLRTRFSLCFSKMVTRGDKSEKLGSHSCVDKDKLSFEKQ